MPSFTVFRGSKNGDPRKTITSRPDQLVGDQVLVRVTASGLCGTDLHYHHSDMVLGHEGVGVVEAVGPDAKYLKRGQRVGWGYQTDSCGHCAECLKGEEVFCKERAFYGEANLDQGSFASHAIWREAFLHQIPDGMSDEDAAPLQCGGATVFTTLADVKPNETIGIMGVGGLGHLAIQFAAKMGCRVVVLSGSDSKRVQAMELGARKFVAMNQVKSQGLKDWWPLTRLLVTTAVQPDWSVVLPMMAPKARIYPLTVSSGNLEIPYMPLILEGLTVQGSVVATRAVHRDMLEFASIHGIRPIIEKYPMTEEGIKIAMDRLTRGKVFYRAVLVPQLEERSKTSRGEIAIPTREQEVAVY
ncbi:GroES-like protein [Thozetella sp. PMI_491]|nr:GroES-like protein [Thozetella sp. PMI_491]